LRWRRAPWLHLPAVAWGAVIEITGAICPLTPLENWLRHTGGGATYERDFIAQYVVPIIYPDRLTREMQWLLGCLLVIINVGIYAVVWRRRKKAGPPDGRRRGRPLLAADSEPRDARQSEPAPKGDHISSASAEGLPNRDAPWPGRRRAMNEGMKCGRTEATGSSAGCAEAAKRLSAPPAFWRTDSAENH